MTNDDNGPRDRNAHLNALRDDLADTLTKTETGPDILHRHAHMLDEILMALMGDNATTRINERYISGWIDLVLRIQKQCADTVKTVEAIDYMKHISSKNAAPLPPPPETGERTEGSE